MAQPDSRSVDKYIASKPEAMQGILGRVRSTIRKAVPEADEVISYQIPAYKLHGRIVVFFAGWKEHWALYPASGTAVAAFKDELTAYAISKGTIRFPISQPVPMKLIGRIAKFRAKEVAEREKTKAKKPQARP